MSRHPLDPLGLLDLEPDPQTFTWGNSGLSLPPEDVDDDDFDDEDDDYDEDEDEDDEGEDSPTGYRSEHGRHCRCADCCRSYGPRRGFAGPTLEEACDRIAAAAAEAPTIRANGSIVMTALGVCRGCGCTDERACPGGCVWLEPNLCSRCA